MEFGVNVMSFLQFPLISVLVKGRMIIFILLKKLCLTFFIHRLSFLCYLQASLICHCI